MENIEKCQENESQQENVILCHPNADGDPVVEIFGNVPEPLIALMDAGDSSRYQREYPGHRATFRIGYEEQDRKRHVRLSPERYARALTFKVLEKVNGYSEWSLVPDDDLTVAVEIALERYDGNVQGDLRVITEWLRKYHVSRYEEEYYLEDVEATHANALVAYLLEYLHFRWEWRGWDQEQRFIERGLVRVPGTKIVQDLEGKYILSPRCAQCGEKTGWCQCSEDLDEMMEEAARKHYCNGCYYRREFNELKSEYLAPKKLDGDTAYHMETLVDHLNPITYDDLDRFVRVDHLYSLVNGGANVIVHAHDGQGEEILPWYEFVERHWSDWVELLEEEASESCDGDDYCECPLGV